MKFSVLTTVGALASVTAAQDCISIALTAIPSCAQPCVLASAPGIGCGGTDFACMCEKQAALMAAVEPCVATACPSASAQAVIDGAAAVCSCAATAVPTNTAAGTVAPSGTVTKPPTTVPTAAANRPVMNKELGIAAGVLGGTLLLALAL